MSPDSEVEMFNATPLPPPIIRCPPRARPNALVRAWRAVRRFVLSHWYANEVACVASERNTYSERTYPRAGARHRAELDRQLMDLRNKQAWLEIET